MTDGGPARPGTDRELLELMPFAVTLGVELDAASAREVRGHLAWSPERCTAGGILHGRIFQRNFKLTRFFGVVKRDDYFFFFGVAFKNI